ncbi:MAG TPA: VOC family protein [Gemmataceae bacterium]|jgi:predicted enzyme related to lactoylglutathione lyase|nr:VOC family protein [Gemmataceae bacterium]
MEINKVKPGNFCWFELATTDQAAAKKFYGGLFSWTANDAPMGPDAFYTMFQLRGRNVGAAYKLDTDQVKQGVPPHWGTYVAVANADEMVAKAKTLGATVFAGPFDVAEHGRMAVLGDPTGATISLWQANRHPGVGLWGEVGAFCWSELLTRDTTTATKFYTALFGWKTKVTEESGFPYTHWQNDGADIGGMMAIMEQWGPMPPCWVNYVQVQNCDDTTAKATSLGGEVCMPPTDIPNTGRFAMLQDPQGATLSVIALAPMHKG